eukprot:133993-Lingulodinium_polyedra.AAC.1
MNATGSFRLPRREMSIDMLTEWAEARYVQQGKRLSSLKMEGDWVDWEAEVGVVQAIIPADADEKTMINEIRNRFTGEVCPLPNPVALGDLSDKVLFKENYSIDTAKLFDSMSEASQPFKNIFMMALA